MFEKYTEKARRTIFFARYEASVLTSPYIETEHLLLGLLREDKVLAERVPAEAIRAEVERRNPVRQQRISTSVDLPLNHDGKKALCFAAEEAERLESRVIHCGHLVLGLLRVDACPAAEILRGHGIRLNEYREIAKGYNERAVESPVIATESAMPESAASALVSLIAQLRQLIRGFRFLDDVSERDTHTLLPRIGLTRQEALGHLIDWATAHHQWLAQAISEPKLATPSYPPFEWAKKQDYKSYPWHMLVTTWELTNELLLHVMQQIPSAKLETPCRVGIAEPITLLQLIGRYVEHIDDVLGQILARG